MKIMTCQSGVHMKAGANVINEGVVVVPKNKVQFDFRLQLEGLRS